MARILIGNIKGPKGDTGAQGPQGETGPQGPQGPLPPLVNNALATEAGVSALDAVMGKTLQDQITDNKEDITQLYSNIEKTGILIFPRFTAFTENVSDMLKSPLCVANVSINTGVSDPYAPIKTEGPHWWNVITIGVDNRCEQLAFRGFSPDLTSDILYLRRQHDNSTGQWIQIK